jgi:hypothetical protein
MMWLGNRCNHDPAKPRLLPVAPIPENLPPALANCMPKIRDLYYSRERAWKNFGAPRSEFREAFCLVVQYLVARMDLLTKRVGSRPDAANRIQGILDDKIAEGAGVSIFRVRRVIRYGRVIGFWTSSPTWELDKKTGDHKGRAAIRCISMKFFRLIQRNLAIEYAALGRAQKAAKKKAAAAAACAAAPPTPETISREAVRMARRRVGRGRVLPAAPLPSPESITDEGQRFAVLAQSVQLKHPDWTKAAVYDEVIRLIEAARA